MRTTVTSCHDATRLKVKIQEAVAVTLKKCKAGHITEVAGKRLVNTARLVPPVSSISTQPSLLHHMLLENIEALHSI